MTTSDYQFLPPLLPEEFEALKTSIAERGVDVPIIVDQDGNVIDGYHRERACDELGIYCPREIRHFDNETDKLELILSLNCRRRQLNRKQKRSVIEAYLLRDPQIADNFLAEIIGGISKNTVAAVRGELEGTCQIDKFDVLRGRDGKQRPVQYKKIVANTQKEVDAAKKVIGDLPDSSAGKLLNVVTARREVETEKRRQDPYDFYPTPRGATEALLRVEQFSKEVWEPACGEGAISDVLKQAGYAVDSSDIVNRGYGQVENFLTTERRATDIITNPPYRQGDEFVRKALNITTRRVAMLFQLSFLTSEKRRAILSESCLKKIYVFEDRVSLYKGGSEYRGNGQLGYAWFIWEHGYSGEPTISWINSRLAGAMLRPIEDTLTTNSSADRGPSQDESVDSHSNDLIRELCIHIWDADDMDALMDSNRIVSEWAQLEGISLSLAERLVKELPDEVRRLLDNGLPPAA
ncbi:ParB N-terminal domain-containing protein [Thalassoroseus pseudoceratinae]|uniref:ParB N-terminal domain-containing protein n=1 Tax=Thalassoroseus pseudoceratinae TaxID=2713176 RepID=UPI0014226E42|nr:ParB N-terminal domain-containing protein [Thalassoroseus pseudoceratinae]